MTDTPPPANQETDAASDGATYSSLPIDSAPKDGTLFIGICGQHAAPTKLDYYYVKFPHEEGGPTYRAAWKQIQPDDICPWNPTHWIPFPSLQEITPTRVPIDTPKTDLQVTSTVGKTLMQNDNHALLRIPLSKCEDVETLINAAEALWSLLDDIDTACDMFKPTDEAGYRKFYTYTMQKVGLRQAILPSDGYDLFLPARPTEHPRPMKPMNEPKMKLTLKPCGDCWLHIDAPSGLRASINLGQRGSMNDRTIVGRTIREVAELCEDKTVIPEPNAPPTLATD